MDNPRVAEELAWEISVLGDQVEQELGAEFDAELEALVAEYRARQAEAEPLDEVTQCLEDLLETRSAIASMQAREQRCLAILETLALRGVGEDAAGSLREVAVRSMIAEIAVATHQSDRTVHVMMSRAGTLVSALPATLAALECGRISFGHARTIVEHVMGLSGDVLGEFERVVLPRAESTTPGKLARFAKLTGTRLQAESFEERHAKAAADRRVLIRDLDDGMSELIHILPSVLAAGIFDRLSRQAKAVKAGGDPRTRDQVRTDLAAELLLSAEVSYGDDSPHSLARGIRAEVSITIPALTLLGQGTEPATLAGRGPIDLDTALRLASHTPEWTRVITHPVTGIVVAADTYRPTASLRRLVAARDQHCRFPTCQRDIRYCDLDHTLAWENGGTTVPENLAMLCRNHHTLKHHGGWRVTQITPVVLQWTSPTGRFVEDRAGPQFVEAVATNLSPF